jgi:hypothetical protein
MARLTGFLLGAALALAALLALVDASDREALVERFAPPGDHVRPGQDVGTAATAPAAADGPEPTPVPDTLRPAAGGAPPQADAGSVKPEDRPGPHAAPVRWQPVWHGFSSELSARGFADRLRRLGDGDFRVRRTAAWRYQVELAFREAHERDRALAALRAATGLPLAVEVP